MKVNVIGRGFVQGVGLLPQRNIELDEMSVRRLFNFRNCKVYLASTGELLTPAYFDKKKAEAEKAAKEAKLVATKTEIPSAPVAPPVIEPVEPKTYIEPEVIIEEKVEEPVVEETPEEIVEVPVEEAPVFTEEVEAPAIEEPVEEVTEIVETTDEETPAVEEEKPRYNGGKKNKKHR